MARAVSDQVGRDLEEMIAQLGKVNEQINLAGISPEQRKRVMNDREALQSAMKKAADAIAMLGRMWREACALPPTAVVELSGPEVALFSFGGQ